MIWFLSVLILCFHRLIQWSKWTLNWLTNNFPLFFSLSLFHSFSIVHSQSTFCDPKCDNWTTKNTKELTTDKEEGQKKRRKEKSERKEEWLRVSNNWFQFIHFFRFFHSSNFLSFFSFVFSPSLSYSLFSHKFFPIQRHCLKRYKKGIKSILWVSEPRTSPLINRRVIKRSN